MRRHIIAASVAIGSIISGSTLAQQTGDVCGRIVDHGLNNVVLRTSALSLADRTYWDYCDEKYENMSDSKKAEFGITIKGVPFSGKAAGASAREQHSKFCGTYKASTDMHSQEALMTSRMHDRAIDAWRSCVTALNSGMSIDFRIPANQRYADIFLRYTGPTGQTNFNGIESTGFSCSINGDTVGPGSKLAITPAETAIRCERQFITQDVGGVTSEYFPDGGITVKSDAGNSSTEFVAMVEGPAKNRFSQVDTRIAGVRASLNELSGNLLNWDASDPTRGNKIGWGNASESTVCPAGQYAVGFQTWIAPGNIKYCIGCGSGFQVICRPLNSSVR